MKLKLLFERLNFRRGDFFIQAWILRENKTPPQKEKCPPGWMNCRLVQLRWEEGFGHSHMLSKTAKTAQVIILIFILLFLPVVILNRRWWGVFISCARKLSLAEEFLEKTLGVLSISVLEAQGSLKFSCLSSDPLSALGHASDTYHYSSGYLMLFQLTLENWSTFSNSLFFVLEAFTNIDFGLCIQPNIYIHANKTTCIIYILNM